MQFSQLTFNEFTHRVATSGLIATRCKTKNKIENGLCQLALSLLPMSYDLPANKCMDLRFFILRILERKILLD